MTAVTSEPSWFRSCVRPGTRSDGLDLGLYEGCDLGPGPELGARPARDIGMPAAAAGRLRRGGLPGRAVQ